MTVSDYFQVGQSYASFRPVGTVSLQETIDVCVQAILLAGEQHISRLLINLTGLTGFSAPSTAERFMLGKRFAAAAKPAMAVVLVIQQEMIDPERFGVIVARNRGLLVNVFSTEEQARLWLFSPTQQDEPA